MTEIAILENRVDKTVDETLKMERERTKGVRKELNL